MTDETESGSVGGLTEPTVVIEDAVPLTDAQRATPSTQRVTDESSPAQEAWVAEYVQKPEWNLAEVLVWVAIQDPARIGRVFGPDADGPTILNPPGDTRRLGTILTIIEVLGNPVDRWPRATLEQALQRGELHAAGVPPGGHATHRLKDILGNAFWRKDVMKLWPRNPAKAGIRQETPSDSEMLALWSAAKDDEGYVSQARAVELVREKFGKVDRNRVRKLHGTTTTHKNRGPVPGASKTRQELRTKRIAPA